MAKIYIKDLTREELGDELAKLGAKPYAADQVYDWLYKKKAASFEAMTNLKKELRDRLEAAMEISLVEPAARQVSALDGTQKFLLKLKKGGMVECVFLPYPGRLSACISTQAGCRQACSFCATATMGLKRNLSCGEIVDQLLFLERETGQTVRNLVFMGMGEPLDNYDEVKKAVAMLHDQEGINLGARRMTLSTCGLAPEIERLGEEKWPVSLAISLNATTDAERDRIMPINRRYPLWRLMAAAKKYADLSGRSVTFEYVLIAGVTDGVERADRIAGLVRGIPCKINLIPLNKVKRKAFETSPDEAVRAFHAELMKRGLRVYTRAEKGDDIDAACGQLRVSYETETAAV